MIAVYATGYARTRAAAAEFADGARDRPPVHPAKQDAVVPVATPAPPAVQPSAKPKVIADSARPSPRKKAVAKATKPDTAAKTAAVASAPPPVAAVPPPSVTTVTPPPTIPPKDTAAKVAVAAVTDTSTKSDKPAAYKDGMFTGWGTSRHGDIQATVMIKDGKIVGAVISECLTQYSCSWISMLPQQVLDRQSAEVDFVSGATQSTNAFYYAVLNALKKAK